jgi:hypothetical protein
VDECLHGKHLEAEKKEEEEDEETKEKKGIESGSMTI